MQRFPEQSCANSGVPCVSQRLWPELLAEPIRLLGNNPTALESDRFSWKPLPDPATLT